jgi:hypothetical protein
MLPAAGLALGAQKGVSGFLHPEGIYDDPKGGQLRAAVYPRLRAHFQFQNQHMFSELVTGLNSALIFTLHRINLFVINMLTFSQPKRSSFALHMMVPVKLVALKMMKQVPGMKRGIKAVF